MNHLPSSRMLIFCLLTMLLLTGAVYAEEDASCAFPADLASSLLAGTIDLGDLNVTARFVVDEQVLLDEGRLVAGIEGELDAGPLRLLSRATLCVAVLLDVDGEARLVHQNRLEFDDFATADSLRYVLRADLPEGTRHMTFIVREAESGIWGAAPMEEPGEPLDGPGLGAVRVAAYEGSWYELSHRHAEANDVSPAGSTGASPAGSQASGGQTAGSQPAGAGSATNRTRAATVSDNIIRLVPPRNQPVSGSTTFSCLVSSNAVDRVVIEVDGVRAGEDKRQPFRIRVPLAKPAKEQAVRAIAYDSAGKVMGEDLLWVNRRNAPFRARITDFEGDPATGEVQVTATVSVPTGAELARVEFYRNDELLKTFSQPPFQVRVATPEVSLEDFVRVAAYLTDGSSIDDVILIAAPDSSEEVEVNLVQLHAVVTNAQGRPIEDLGPEDFEIEYQGRKQSTQSFAFADDVPLVLGLMVDTSGSMELLMHDTRRAAARFLGTTVLPQDRAFLVDFDLQPRLLHGVTGDLPALMRDLGRLNADGRTAMYDAVIFSMLQFEGQAGRRALVILTDGDDLDSRFGPKHCAEMAKQAGVPVYLIGLGALDTLQRTYNKGDLRKITEDTGGRLYFVDTFEQLNQAYAEINAELRSQYSLSFYTEQDLSDEEKRRIKVRVKGKGLSARTVVGSGLVLE